MAAIEQNLYGINDKLIQEITERIVRECQPHKIILFGSFAWGKPKPHSDVDLFVIMDSPVARPDLRAMQIKKGFVTLIAQQILSPILPTKSRCA